MKSHLAETISGSAAPVAVRPRPDNEHVKDTGIVPFDLRINFERAKQIFRIKPAPHGHHRSPHVLQMRPKIALLPKAIVRPVLHELRPELDLTLEKFRFDVRERTDVQVEFIAIGRFVIERLWVLPRRFFKLLAESGKEPKCMRQIERAVVMKVVPDEPIGNWRLRR